MLSVNFWLIVLSLHTGPKVRTCSFACSSRYLRRCILFNFFSETRRIWRAVSVASLCRNFINKYIGSCPRPEARRLRPLCQPSTSLLVRMAFLNAVQSEGPHVPLIQVSFTYSVNCCRRSEACR